MSMLVTVRKWSVLLVVLLTAMMATNVVGVCQQSSNLGCLGGYYCSIPDAQWQDCMSSGFQCEYAGCVACPAGTWVAASGRNIYRNLPARAPGNYCNKCAAGKYSTRNIFVNVEKQYHTSSQQQCRTKQPPSGTTASGWVGAQSQMNTSSPLNKMCTERQQRGDSHHKTDMTRDYKTYER